MASSFTNVPAVLAHQLEISSDQFKAYLQELKDEPQPASDQRLEQIQDYLDTVQLWSNEFVYVHDIDTGRFYHEGLEEALDYDMEDLTPDFFVRNIHPGDLPRYFEISKALLAFVRAHSPDLVPFTSSCHVKYRMRTADGTYVPVLRKSTPFLKNDDEQVVAYISRCIDISRIHDNNDHKVKWRVFGPKSDHFEDFLEEIAGEQPGNNLFTEREMDVLRLLRDGLTSAEIAEKLFISVNTVNTHRKSLMRKAEVDNTVDLLFFAQEHGYL
jgi:DNA-binding CsgD family transcriptional regulator